MKNSFTFTPVYLKNFRKGLATNSSSTHSLIYRNDGELYEDLDVFELDYYDRFDSTIAASKQAKIKYILADIMYNEPLVRAMSEIYPEMKQYFPLIKESMEELKECDYTEKFGMCFRGELDFGKNLEASVDYLKGVIENNDIIIVGGSDETDFVYDKIRGHVLHPDPSDVESYSGGVTKNGNYWVGFGSTDDRVVVNNEQDEYFDQREKKNSYNGRIRFTRYNESELIPEYPELIDLKITNMCDHGCPFCFMDSNTKGKHADINFLHSIITNIGDCIETGKNRVEFSIGGGNVLLYPHFEELVKRIKAYGHVANVTINVNDIDTILKDDKLLSTFVDFVDGVGISVFDVDDLRKVGKFRNKFTEGKRNTPYLKPYFKKYVTIHLIPEMLGVEKTVEILEENVRGGNWTPFLFLGYKRMGRAEKMEDDVKLFTNDELARIFKGYSSISIDTTFGNRYFDWIKDHFSYKSTITLNEGEFSMYIDAVNKKAYKSSYQLEKGYDMDYKKINSYSVKEAFEKIRKDGGFKVYGENEKHYYDNAKHYWEE